MASPRDEARGNAGEWIRYANDHLRVARSDLSMADVPYRIVAFHAQQCAEKALKGVLVSRSLSFPFTHNISLLLERCEAVAPWTNDAADADSLSVYAGSVRYPGRDEPVTAEEADVAISLADSVLQKAMASVGR